MKLLFPTRILVPVFLLLFATTQYAQNDTNPRFNPPKSTISRWVIRWHLDLNKSNSTRTFRLSRLPLLTPDMWMILR